MKRDVRWGKGGACACSATGVSVVGQPAAASTHTRTHSHTYVTASVLKDVEQRRGGSFRGALPLFDTTVGTKTVFFF